MTLKFVITARNTREALARVVTLFHRAAVEIRSIHMPARGRSINLKITITVDDEHPNAQRMPVILERSPDVLFLETRQSENKFGP